MIKLPPRYSQIIQHLAGGGMSDTLVCKDAHLERNVVIKSLKPGMAKHRLMDELSALSAIRSNYVVQVLDVIYDEGEIIGFVEEYIPGSPLMPLPANSTPNAALRALYPIATGVSHVHSHGRVHRDLKPDNMKVDGEGVLKIFDFGLAKLDAAAKTKQLFYSQGYSAPEIFKADSKGDHNFTSAVDVFALGAIAVWLLCDGKLPTELENVPPTLPCAQADFSAIMPSLPPSIAQLLNACLAADPSKRPNARTVAEQIGKYLLFDKHRMLLTHKGQEFSVNSSSRTVKLSSGNDSVSIKYDGLDFIVTSVSGFALRNNKQLKIGDKLTGAAVIVLGDPINRMGRTSITADVSYPEVLL
ncbi:serine/threonine protein kinase [Mesorhizobium sp. CO1-1-7]|uniref:serine/threonine protein kinase n=1 Tax=Mesorhizobium sp. CO1-1-7 TaxID=2876632 RepID=UPI001CD15ABB|nr:serine/threonine-protein kinase [Mesorhizobium sp. CO1-1-7]MBZ9747239.1 serine/threonine protein kinase [Mesorhizobium sp. CO1-1-7]